MPLAIELAAARIRLFPPLALLNRMRQRFRLLASSEPTGGRSSTLRAVLDWSWALLPEAEQHGLAQLTVFEGGFTLEAAEAVLSVGDAWAMDVVQSLVDKSLLTVIPNERFELLMSVQEYAAEQLADAAPVLARHGEHYAELGALEALELLSLTHGRDERRALVRELDNLISACRHAISPGDADVATRTLTASWAVLRLQGPASLAIALAREVVAMPGLSAVLAAHCERIWALALRFEGDRTAAKVHLERSLVTALASGERLLEARTRRNLGAVLHELGDPEGSRTHLNRALAIATELGNRHTAALAHRGLAHLANADNDLVAARAHLDAALAGARATGDASLEAGVVGAFGTAAWAEGRLDLAK